MSLLETPHFFDCEGCALLGVLHAPPSPGQVGVVIVVGGPQYRVGSHRQFVLLARELAAAGYPCLRFDYRGMGDSEGPKLDFEHVDHDIRAAIDLLRRQVPSVDRVVLWGLCDGASATALYATSDPRVAGLAMFNPWVRTPTSEAQVMLKHYYLRRLLNRDFWQKLRGGNVDVASALASIWNNLRRAGRGWKGRDNGDSRTVPSLPERVGRALSRNPRSTLIGLSLHDDVAAEFRMVASRSETLGTVMAGENRSIVEFNADHTFSSAEWRSQAADATLKWLRAHFPDEVQRPDPTGATGSPTHYP